MRTRSKGTYGLANVLNRELYGTTIDEERQKIQAMITRCYTQMQMSVKEIAEFSGETTAAIRKILKSQNLLP